MGKAAISSFLTMGKRAAFCVTQKSFCVKIPAVKKVLPHVDLFNKAVLFSCISFHFGLWHFGHWMGLAVRGIQVCKHFRQESVGIAAISH
jgi:hypothetical protein